MIHCVKISGEWFYSVAFKVGNSSALHWIDTPAQDPSEASRIAREYMAKRYAKEGYTEYGISRTNPSSR